MPSSKATTRTRSRSCGPSRKSTSAASKDAVLATCDSGYVRDPLHRNCRGFATTDAQGSDAAFQILRFQRMQQRHDQPRAGGADGMAERAGAAIDVQLFSG